MPSSSGYVDRLLTEWASALQPQGLVGDLIAPRVSVPDQAGKYKIFGAESLRLRVDTATPTSEIHEIDYEWSTGTYYAGGHALEHFVPRRNMDFEGEYQAATDLVMEGVLLNREKAIYTLMTSATAIPASDTPGTKWSASSTDIASWLYAQGNAVAAKVGVRPNTLVIGSDVLAVLLENTALLDRVKYTQAGILTPDVLGPILGIDRVIVAGAVAATSNEGATSVAAAMWPAETGVLYYSTPAPTGRSADAVKTLVWNGEGGGAQQGVEVRRIPDELRGTHGGEWVRAVLYYDHVVTNAAAAIRLTNLLP